LLPDLGRALEDDLDWRTAELAIFRELLTTSSRHETQRRALFRGTWALLYAHYEGFVKFCLESYIERVCGKCNDCNSITDRMFVYLFDKEIKTTKSMTSEESYHFFKNDVVNLRNSSPIPVTVDTKSNLWPSLLSDILIKLEINADTIQLDERKLTTLVARRNDIAHGKRVFIDDLSYYIDYERAATNTMYSLALAVVERCESL
jgi:hypothetical protein